MPPLRELLKWVGRRGETDWLAHWNGERPFLAPSFSGSEELDASS